MSLISAAVTTVSGTIHQPNSQTHECPWADIAKNDPEVAELLADGFEFVGNFPTDMGWFGEGGGTYEMNVINECDGSFAKSKSNLEKKYGTGNVSTSDAYDIDGKMYTGSKGMWVRIPVSEIQ